MSSNDPLDAQPLDKDSITPPPADYQPPSAIEGEHRPVPPGWRPEVEVPERPIAQQPRWPHPNFWWSILWCVLFLLVTQLPGGILAVIVALGLMALSPDKFSLDGLNNQTALLKSDAMSIGLAVGIGLTEILVVGFSLLIIRLVVGRDWMRQLAVRRPSLTHAAVALASLPALMLLGNVAYSVLRNVLHLPSLSDFGFGGMEEMVQIASKWPSAFAVLVIGLGPGLGEELWCRGFLGRGLVGNYGAVLGVIASSFFFGVIHMDPCQGTMAMLMGLWLHFVYLTSRSLWLPILMHFINNSLGVLGSKIPLLARLDDKPDTIPVFVYVTAVLLLGAAAYALYQSRARLASEDSERPSLWRPAYPSVEYPPPGSGTRVVHPTLSLPALMASFGGFLLFVAACVMWAQG
jgi:membrane protease YdiL (CAAX protease family)